MFILDPRLEADTLPVGALALSRVRLMDDSRFPWLVLVPARADAREIHDLLPGDRALLIEEIAVAARALAALHGPGKINVGALGNLVAQLHVHVVARREGDAAWPGPVWGAGARVPYGAEAKAGMLAGLRQALPEMAS